MMVSEQYFETLGARPALGRTFTMRIRGGEHRSQCVGGCQPSRSARERTAARAQRHRDLPPALAAALSRTFRRRRSAPRLASGFMVEIVGVMGPEMRAIAPAVGVPPEWWMPRVPSRTGRGNTLETVARLAPGQSLDSARAELATVGASIAAAFPGAKPGRTFQAIPLLEMVVKDVRSQFVFLLGASLCVLLVTCVNVVHLFLATPPAAVSSSRLASRSVPHAAP